MFQTFFIMFINSVPECGTCINHQAKIFKILKTTSHMKKQWNKVSNHFDIVWFGLDFCIDVNKKKNYDFIWKFSFSIANLNFFFEWFICFVIRRRLISCFWIWIEILWNHLRQEKQRIRLSLIWYSMQFCNSNRP